MPLSPTPGTAASNAGFTLVPGTGLASDIEEYINRALDEVAQKALLVGGGAVPIANGGTAATTATAARSNLGVTAANLNAWANSGAGTGTLGFNGTRLQYEVPGYAFPTNVANYGDVNDRVAKAGDTMTGDLFVPNATAANSSWVNAFINGDGRLCKGSSSERYKKNITAMDPASFAEMFPGLFRYKMRSQGAGNPSDEVWHYGWIAERLDESEALRPFVVYDAEGRPESIDFIGLLIVQTANLNARVTRLEEAL